MAEAPKETTIPLRVRFTSADPEGTAPVRAVAGHAARVAAAWQALSGAMFDLADSLDDLMADPESDGGES